MQKLQYISILCCCLLQIQVAAQGQVDILLDSTNFLIGDPLDIQIVVNIPKGNTVQFATNIAKELEEQKLEVLSIDPVERKVGATNTTSKQALTVTAWEPKAYEIPSLKYYYTTGNDTTYIQSLPLTITAKAPTVTGDSNYVADIKPILAEESTMFDKLAAFFSNPFILAALIMSLLGPLFIGIWYWLTNKKHTAEAISPEELAWKRLEKLKQNNPLDKNDFVSYHTQISLILRAYLNGRFDIKALEKPLSSTLPKIEKNPYLNDDLYRELVQVLHHADLIKFAKASPLDIANTKAMETSYLLINTIRRQLIKEAERAARK